MLSGNTYGLSGSLLLVQRGAKESQRQGRRNCNVIVNHIKDISVSKLLCYNIEYWFCYVMLFSGSQAGNSVFDMQDPASSLFIPAIADIVLFSFIDNL